MVANSPISPLMLIVFTLLVLVIIALRQLWQKYLDQPVFKLFSLSSSNYRLVGTDIGGRTDHAYLRSGPLGGVPDALFVNKRKRHGFIGEYKSRQNKGRPSLREKYQVILYMGMAMEKYGLIEIKGAIRYRENIVPVLFDASLYQRLRNLEGEVLLAKKKWIPLDTRPLHCR